MFKNLNQVNIRQRLDGLRSVGQCVEVTFLGLGVLSLQVLSLDLAGLDVLLDLLVGLLAGDDLGLASGRLQVRSGDVDLLSQDSAVDLRFKKQYYIFYKPAKKSCHLLVHNNSDSSLGHVENNAGSAVVEFEGHTLVDGGVDFDVNIVSSLLARKKLK